MDNPCFKSLGCFTEITCTVIFSQMLCLLSFSCLAQRDPGWPRQVSKDGNTLVYYQPQIRDWKNYEDLSADIAFALTPKGSTEIHGVASFYCHTTVDKTKRTVYLSRIAVPMSAFRTKPKQNLLKRFFAV